MHTEVTYRAPAPWRRMKSTVSPSARASATPAPPGTQTRSSGGALVEGAGRHDAETTVARHRLHRPGEDVDRRLRKPAGNRDRRRRPEPAQHFERPGEVELRDPGEDHEADGEIGHAPAPACSRLRTSRIIAPGDHLRNATHTRCACVVHKVCIELPAANPSAGTRNARPMQRPSRPPPRPSVNAILIALCQSPRFPTTSLETSSCTRSRALRRRSCAAKGGT